MITYVANIINLLASILQSLIFITSAIGQIIVLTITTVTTIITNCLASVLEFFKIVYEDNVAIFTEDLPNLSSEIIEAIWLQWCYFHDVILTLCNETTFNLKLLINNIKWSFTAVLVVCGEVLSIIKKTIIFLGDTLWIVITFVPIHLPHMLKVFLRNLRDTFINYVIDAYMALLKVTNFLSDVPLESFMGIITAILLVRSFIHFRETILSHIYDFYWIVIRKMTYWYYTVYNYFTNSEVRVISRLVGGQHMVTESMDVNLDHDDNVNAADALCVVCQERQKSVLTLPCRHVCLCTECCMRLYGYQRTCPICRTFIYHSVNIYL